MENEGVVPLNNKIFDPNMVNHTIDIYYFPMSPPSRAVLMTMRALGIKHNIKITHPMSGDTMKPEFLKMNPLHTIPVIDDNGFILYDSGAIMKYLVDRYGKDDSLYPKDAKKGARVTQRLFYVTGYLFPRFFATHAVIMLGGSVPDADKEKLRESFSYLDKILEDSKWIAGDNMTIADFAIVSLLANIDSAGLYDLSTYANLWQYFQRSKSGMESFGYEEIMQSGADQFGSVFKH
ncbi:unnamed protein product [Psylliodes chrysocephalus]|uniref:Uncharacterized protein n=1 Tax=Psylliodes chrysocephalus TaxID=3402493 RepID=A0A9P0D744_9CUCU|nr:unnamed protein product [Psylliodes chrysocephala]